MSFAILSIQDPASFSLALPCASAINSCRLEITPDFVIPMPVGGIITFPFPAGIPLFARMFTTPVYLDQGFCPLSGIRFGTQGIATFS